MAKKSVLASALGPNGSNVWSTANGTFFHSVGSGLNANTAATEAQLQIPIRGACTLSLLSTYIINNARGNATTIGTRKNGAAGNQSISIPAAATGFFQDSSNSDHYNDGDTICYQTTLGNGATALGCSYIAAQMKMDAGSAQQYFGCTDTVGAIVSTSTASQSNFIPYGGRNTVSTVDSDAGTRPEIAAAGTFSNLSGSIVTNGRSTDTLLRFRKNSANGNQAITIAAGATGFFEDVSNSDTVALQDKCGYSFVTGTGAGTIQLKRASSKFVGSNDEVPYIALQTQNAASGTGYVLPHTAMAITVTENDIVQFPALFDCNITGVIGAAGLFGSPGGGNSNLVRTRVNGANGNCVASTTGTTPLILADFTHTDTLIAGDKYDVQWIIPNVANLGYICLRIVDTTPPDDIEVSKVTGYVILDDSPLREAASKVTGYVVLKQPDTENVSKLTGYVVVQSTGADQEEVAKLTAYVVIFVPGIERLSLIVAEPVTDGEPNVRSPLVVVEPVTDGEPDVRLPLIFAEPLTGGNPVVRCPIIAIEIIYGLREPVVPATANFPAPKHGSSQMRGLGWSVHKKPNFNTKISDHVSGHEVRVPFMQYPRWEFNLTFEYLPNKDGAKDLEQIMGFFLQRQGSFDAFLFRDVTDYLALAQPVGVGDGGTLRWQASRTLGGFTEIVGQFDLDEQFSFLPADVNTGADTVAVANHGYATGYGPVQLVATAGALPAGLLAAKNYWLIAASDSTLKFALSEADAVAGTAVNITGVGTTGPFVASNSIAVYADGVEIAPGVLTVTLPNIIELDVAPDPDVVITWTGKYFFVCRFIEDVQDYENFMYNLWTLQECNFKSVLTVE